METYNFLRKKYFIPPEKSLNEFSTPTFADWGNLIKLLEEYSDQIEPQVMPKIAEDFRHLKELAEGEILYYENFPPKDELEQLHFGSWKEAMSRIEKYF